MNRYKLSKVGVNATEGIARFNGNKEMYESVLNEFLADKNYKMLCAAIKEQNVKAAFVAAHSLKGVAGNLSMTRLYDDIYPLVEILRAESFDNVGELLSVVKEDYEAIIAVLSLG